MGPGTEIPVWFFLFFFFGIGVDFFVVGVFLLCGFVLVFFFLFAAWSDMGRSAIVSQFCKGSASNKTTCSVGKDN